MNPGRIREIKKGSSSKRDGPVVYWMSRDQRILDNWALVGAQEIAAKSQKPLVIVFCLEKDFLNAQPRHYRFMVDGLIETEQQAKDLKFPFVVLCGEPQKEIPEFITNINASCLVKDFDPLKIKNVWKSAISSKIDISFYEIDSHNIVPCWIASGKMEYGAYTIRPKIKRLLPEYLEDYPADHLKDYNKTVKNNASYFSSDQINNSFKYELSTVKNVMEKIFKTGPEKRIGISEKLQKPGIKAAFKCLDTFINKKLDLYDKYKNDPNEEVISGLSPYLHFGQISAQRIALDVYKSGIDDAVKESFLEELIIRRELSDNYCMYNKDYDCFEGLPQWSRDSLNIHRFDRRPYFYNLEQFENAGTHDDLWNASQTQMVKTGKMHGYMRMYWAKKILEWCRHPEEAIEIAIYLNDKYSFDGRDPNGYTGIAWSVGGLHDRPWGERSIFGKIRYMSYGGCKRKFNIDSFIEKVNNI